MTHSGRMQRNTCGMCPVRAVHVGADSDCELAIVRCLRYLRDLRYRSTASDLVVVSLSEYDGGEHFFPVASRKKVFRWKRKRDFPHSGNPNSPPQREFVNFITSPTRSAIDASFVGNSQIATRFAPVSHSSLRGYLLLGADCPRRERVFDCSHR